MIPVATTLHFYSPEKLFNRAIATGGSFLLVGPFSPEIYEGIYQRVLSVLGLDGLEPEERIKQLLSLPLDDVIAKLPPDIPFLPVIDGDIIPVRPSYGAVAGQEDHSIPGKAWLDGFLIGDSQFDVRAVSLSLGIINANKELIGINPWGNHGPFEKGLTQKILSITKDLLGRYTWSCRVHP